MGRFRLLSLVVAGLWQVFTLWFSVHFLGPTGNRRFGDPAGAGGATKIDDFRSAQKTLRFNPKCHIDFRGGAGADPRVSWGAWGAAALRGEGEVQYMCFWVELMGQISSGFRSGSDLSRFRSGSELNRIELN